MTRRRCKDLTLLYLPSLQAFAIRTCSFLTRHSHFFQSMLFQEEGEVDVEDAHVDFSSFICYFFIKKVLQSFCKESPCGSLPAFAEDNIENLIHPITGRRSLHPQSHTHLPFGSPCGKLTFRGEGGNWAYQVPYK